jgi:hypothetical protein
MGRTSRRWGGAGASAEEGCSSAASPSKLTAREAAAETAPLPPAAAPVAGPAAAVAAAEDEAPPGPAELEPNGALEPAAAATARLAGRWRMKALTCRAWSMAEKVISQNCQARLMQMTPQVGVSASTL